MVGKLSTSSNVPCSELNHEGRPQVQRFKPWTWDSDGRTVTEVHQRYRSSSVACWRRRDSDIVLPMAGNLCPCMPRNMAYPRLDSTVGQARTIGMQLPVGLANILHSVLHIKPQNRREASPTIRARARKSGNGAGCSRLRSRWKTQGSNSIGHSIDIISSF